jgi:carnitine O-acetyltransferase
MAINWLLLISTIILLPRQASSLRSTLPMIRSSLTALERSAMTTKIKNYRHNAMKMTSTSTTASTSFLLKQWPKTMVESRGDYREEEFLEKCIGGPLYEHQATLPRLPVLQVNDTIQKLVPTVLPLSSSPEQSSSFIQKATSFEQQSQHLQQRLITRASTEYKNSSWLQHWWNVLGYLKVRDSVVINVSYFFHLADDATLPLVASSSDDKMILRAACVLHAVANHRLLVCSGGLPQETIGKQKQPLCSVAFKYMFHSCRIPRRDADTYRMYDPSRYKHVIVARKGRYYTMNFVDEKTDQPLPLSVLTSQLQQIIDEEATTGTTPIQLGWLTTQDRDSWADAREELLSVGGVTAKDALDKLESGAILLCLDEEEPVSRMQCGKHFLHGSSASANNRWFDKSIQIVCCKNGKVGLVGEHSMIDGMPMVGLADRITKTTYASIIAAGGDDKKDQLRSASGGVHDIFADCEKLWTGTQVEKSIEKGEMLLGYGFVSPM